MNGTPKDIDPASDLREEDEEQALPELEAAEQPAGTLAAGRAAIARAVKHAPSQPGVYRMIDAQGRGALRRQGEEHQETGHRLYAADRARQPHRAHDLRHGDDGIRHHQDRDRSAAARSQSDQAAAPALQRAAARRQVVPLHPDHVRPLGAADPQASRRAHAGRALLRAVRQCRRGQPHHQRAAARVPAALLLGFVFRGAHAAVPALSDQALLGALHAGDRFRRLWRTGARGQRISSPAAAGWCRRRWRRKWTRRRRRSISSAPRSIATGWRRCRRSPRIRASIRARSRRPTCSPCIRPAAIPASRCSSSAPGRTGATALIFRRPTARSAPAKC